MTIYELLESKQKYRRPFSSGEEFLYFIETSIIMLLLLLAL